MSVICYLIIKNESNKQSPINCTLYIPLILGNLSFFLFFVYVCTLRKENAGHASLFYTNILNPTIKLKQHGENVTSTFRTKSFHDTKLHYISF